MYRSHSLIVAFKSCNSSRSLRLGGVRRSGHTVSTSDFNHASNSGWFRGSIGPLAMYRQLYLRQRKLFANPHLVEQFGGVGDYFAPVSFRVQHGVKYCLVWCLIYLFGSTICSCSWLIVCTRQILGANLSASGSAFIIKDAGMAQAVFRTRENLRPLKLSRDTQRPAHPMYLCNCRG